MSSGCSNGAAQAPPPPPAPKLGPTATFKCTFVMDEMSRNFALSANSTLDLRIVAAIPRFKDRAVTITCDNGTKTQTTTRF